MTSGCFTRVRLTGSRHFLPRQFYLGLFKQEVVLCKLVLQGLDGVDGVRQLLIEHVPFISQLVECPQYAPRLARKVSIIIIIIIASPPLQELHCG